MEEARLNVPEERGNPERIRTALKVERGLFQQVVNVNAGETAIRALIH